VGENPPPLFFVEIVYCTENVAVLLVTDCVLALFLDPELSAACAVTE
jgi:hypothetical protein